MKTLRSIVTVACALSLAGCGLDVMYADWKVDRLCKHDGGVKVFETDSPPTNLRKADGNIDLEALQDAKPGASYYLVVESTLVQATEPEIRRLEERLVRGRDGAVLGSSVVYLRANAHAGIPFSSRRGRVCPDSSSLARLTRAVFVARPAP